MSGRTRTTDAEKVQPHNLEAERAVLGAMLIEPDRIPIAAAALEPAHFFRAAHRIVFRALTELADQPTRADQIDLVTLKAALTRTGQLDDVGGPAYLSNLVDGVPRSMNLDAYLALVRDAALLRQIIQTGSEIVARAYEADEPARAIMRWAEDRWLDLSGGYRGAAERLSGAVGRLMHDLDYRVSHKGELTGITTGFGSIDDLTMGWQAGDLVIIAARPSVGKTTFVINSAVAAAQAGRKVAIYSLEMRRRQIEYRILSSLSGVPLTRLLKGFLSDLEWPRIGTAMEAMSTLHIDIDDSPGLTARDIRSACRRLRAADGLDMVVIDYVQLMPGTLDRRGSSRNEEVTDISRRLKSLAEELSVPVLLLSQLNRGAAARTDPKPVLSDLRESGSLEQDADIVAFLHRKSHREDGTTQFIIEKQRNGPTGTVNLTITRDITRFDDGGDDPPPAPTPEPKKARPPRLPYRRGED